MAALEERHDVRMVGTVLRRPVAAVALLALAVRAGTALIVFMSGPPSTVPDELQYLGLARQVAAGHSADSWYPGYGQALYTSTWTFTAGLVQLMKVFGGSRLAGQLAVAVVGALGAALVVHLARQVVGARWALGAGAVVALLPSQVLFSSLVLREAHVWLGVGAVWLGACWLSSDDDGRMPLLGLATCSAGILALGFLRQQTMLVTAIALVLCALAQWHRPARLAAALSILLVVPAVAGIGVGGWTLIDRGSSTLARTRTDLAVGAQTAIGPTRTTDLPGTGTVPTTRPDKAEPGAVGIASRGSDDVIIGPDGRPYAIDESMEANLRALPRGLVASMVRPFPWEAPSSLTGRLAAAENLVWYPLYALAVAGAWTAARDARRRRLLLFPAAVIVGVLVVGALSQGNLGTAFRHRQQIAAPLVVLAAVGAERVARRRAIP